MFGYAIVIAVYLLQRHIPSELINHQTSSQETFKPARSFATLVHVCVSVHSPTRRKMLAHGTLRSQILALNAFLVAACELHKTTRFPSLLDGSSICCRPQKPNPSRRCCLSLPTDRSRTKKATRKKTMTNNLESLRYSNKDGKPQLSVLDQLLIPHSKEYIDIPDVEAAWSVIRKMQIRGASLSLSLCV